MKNKGEKKLGYGLSILMKQRNNIKIVYENTKCSIVKI